MIFYLGYYLYFKERKKVKFMNHLIVFLEMLNIFVIFKKKKRRNKKNSKKKLQNLMLQKN